MPRNDTSHLYDLVHDAIDTLNVRQLATLTLEIRAAMADRGFYVSPASATDTLMLTNSDGHPYAQLQMSRGSAPLWRTFSPDTHHGKLLDNVTP